MALTQVTSIGIKNGEIVNADLHSAAAIVLSKLNTTGTASSSTFLRGDGAWTAMSADGGNAATLDSIDSSQFLRSDAADSYTGTTLNFNNSTDQKIILSGSTNPYIRWQEGTTNRGYVQFYGTDDKFYWINEQSDTGLRLGSSLNWLSGSSSWHNVWHAGNDGSGSGLDADTLDGRDSNTGSVADTIALRDSSSNLTGAGFISTGGTTDGLVGLAYGTNYFGLKTSSQTLSSEYMIISANADTYISANSGYNVNIRPGGNSSTNQLTVSTSGTTIGGSTVWHTGNDGSGSGLDADKLDGQEGSYYRNASNLNAGTYPDLFSSSTRYNIGLIDGHNGDSYDKLRVWDGSYYAIGMHSGMTHGWLNDYAMTFSMNDNTSRGFVWRDSSDGQNEAAMSLSTDGNLNVGNAIGIAGNTSNYWMNGSWGFRHKTPHGYIEFGPANTSHAHIYTDRSNFYFNKTVIYANGNTMFHAGNDGSGSGLDADTLDGLQLGTGRNNSANQVVRTNVHGYIDAGYINTSCDDTGTGVDCKFYASQDDYIRYIDKASMRSVVNSPARSSAYEGRESYTSDTNYWMGTMGDGADNFDSTVWDYGSGAFDVWSNPSGQPSGTSHWCGLQSMHYTNGSARYGMRLMLGAGQTALAYIQGRWNTTTYGWHKLWNEGNDGSGSGLDADTVDGTHATGFVRNANNSYHVLQFGSGNNTGNARSSYPYAIFQETGAWSTPYPDLCISYHTGIKIGCGSQSYGGLRFTPDYNSETILMSINNGLETNGNGNVRVNTELYCDRWFRNNDSGEGLYNDASTQHFYSDHDDCWNVAGGSTSGLIRIRDENGGTIRGYVGANNSNAMGFLDYEGSWAFASGKFTNYSYRDLACHPDDGHDLGYGNRRWDNVYATNGTIQTSDRNEKENIVATDLGLAFVNQLNPVSFKRKGKTRTHYGFIAQDIEQIITDLGKTTTQFAPLIKSDISEAKDGSEYRYGLRYEQLLAPVVKAIQELAVKVAALESA